MTIGRRTSPRGEAAAVRVACTRCLGNFAWWVPLLVFACNAAIGATEPKAWLDDMNRALSELDYDGVFSYYTGRDMAALRVVHMVIDGERRERLAYLNGPHREIIRRGDNAVCILSPDDAFVELAGSMPPGPLTFAYSGTFDSISNQYDVARSGAGRIAGRAAERISVTPWDEDRYGYRLWLDQENGLMLRSELIGTNGEKLEVFQFTSIAFGRDVSPTALQPSGDAILRTLHLESAKAMPAQSTQLPLRWHTGWIPAGFSMAAAEVLQSPARPKPVETVMYSDGLASFSVFVEDRPDAVELHGAVRHGATVAVSDQVPAPGGQWALVTLVGEVPEATARRIAASVAYGADF
ncbi:MAG: MucB/RseB C-terminal domain-containing protein [Gammaproteobacteria bacterium]|nr:MucB/RseB C-terminal domain-containing protein [Gammaproteobacteria bacterium]